MSKKVELDLNCPQCQVAFKATLYRTIWVEFPEYMDLIQKDQINVVHCPACGFSEMPPFPFLATNVKKKIAIWYEPIPDKNIDSDIELYRQHYAGDFYLANAPRIKSWEEFKRCLAQLNRRPDVPASFWPDPRFPHRTGYDFRIQEGAERCRGASTRKRR